MTNDTKRNKNAASKPALTVAHSTVPTAARDYIKRGMAPIPVPLRSKGPALNGWQHLRLTEDEVPNYFDGKPSNIGLILGSASGGLVDVDLDCPEAVALAPRFLPPTDAVFGRAGKPRSHWLYRSNLCEGGHNRSKITIFDDKGKEVCGLRIGDGDDSGAQTIVPPSRHKDTGELIEWDGSPNPAQVDGQPLEHTFRCLGVASLLARFWPREQSNRDQLAMAVSGMLAKRGVPEPNAVEIVSAAAEHANDDEMQSRRRAVKDTYRKHVSGDKITGLPKLQELIGNDKAARRMAEVFAPRRGNWPDVTKNGAPRTTLPNTKEAVKLLNIECSYDLFKLQYVIDGHQLDSYMAAEISDPALLRLREMIYEQFGFDPPTKTVLTAVQTLANHRRFHPVRDYLESLHWDGQPRLDKWLISYAGAEDTPYVQAVSSLTLIAAVRRVRQPGCKFDEWLVIEGEQGNAKSQALQLLATKPEWFSDQTVFGLKGRESLEALSGKWIIEAAELHGMRKSDVEAAKAFMSRDTDRGRLAYALTPTESRRQCIIIGTTNNEAYLRDLTGNRRFWPVSTKAFDLEALRRDRDQLWAEATAREASGVSIRLPEELWAVAADEQRERVIDNPFTSTLDQVLRERIRMPHPTESLASITKVGELMTGIITIEDLWTALGIRPSQRSQFHNENLAAALRDLGWNKTRRRFGSGARAYAYTRGEEPHKRIHVIPGEDGYPATAEYENDLEEKPEY